MLFPIQNRATKKLLGMQVDTRLKMKPRQVWRKILLKVWCGKPNNWQTRLQKSLNKTQLYHSTILLISLKPFKCWFLWLHLQQYWTIWVEDLEVAKNWKVRLQNWFSQPQKGWNSKILLFSSCKSRVRLPGFYLLDSFRYDLWCFCMLPLPWRFPISWSFLSMVLK